MGEKVFDGKSNLEVALGILPPDQPLDGEFISADDNDLVSIDDDEDMDLVPVDEPDQDINLPTEIDKEIRDDIQDIYDAAMDAFEEGQNQIDSMEPKYVPRAMEVNKSYLDAALQAAALKQRQREHADKMKIQAAKASGKGGVGSNQTAKTINNNIIVTNRNEALRIAKERNKQKKGDDDK